MARGRKSKNARFVPRRRAARLFRQAGRNKTERQTESSSLAEERVLGVLHEHAGALSAKEIAAALDYGAGERQGLLRQLDDLCHRKQVVCAPDGRYRLHRSADLVEGSLSVHPRGFAFAAVEKAKDPKVMERDLFIPRGALASATHGDRVLLRVTGSSRGRLEARVVRVLKRAVSSLIGIYEEERGRGRVVPDDDRFPFVLEIAAGESGDAQAGQAVQAEIIEHRAEQKNPVARIVKVLGDPDDLQVQMAMVIGKFELPHEFSPAALAETRLMTPTVPPDADRLDLRDILHVTIDGETARDFDDAVALIEEGKGFRLYVSIADVSHFVTPGSQLDREAYQRGTSVYFPTGVVPMLPERLSNDLCSLVPGEDRLAFTAILDFDRQGKRTAMRFTRSIIRSRHRLTYTIVKRILADRDPDLQAEYREILVPLEKMAKLAAALTKRRMARGSIGFEIPESQIGIGEDGKVAGITRIERNLAHKLIEEFMLAANEAVAEAFADKGRGAAALPFLYRIHEAPDPLKVAEFGEFAKTMGLALPKTGQGQPPWFGKVLALVAGTPREYIVSNLLLRAMKQACYAPENAGHFGLAAPYYCHFTSPIRRYPDLMVHRALAAMLAGKKAAKPPKAETLVPATDAGIFLSKRERVAVDAEREMADRLKARFMATKIGMRFEGIVSGVSSFGLFVELLEYFISGAVAIGDLKDDYYSLDEKNHRLVGKASKKMYQVGDLVTVRVSNVNVRRRRIDFVMDDEYDRAW